MYTACDASVMFTVTSPSQILANETISPTSCFNYTPAHGLADGSISLNPSGGSGSNYTTIC